MRFQTFGVAAIALVLGITPAAAAGGFRFDVSGGVSQPTGDFSDVVDMGFQGAVAGTFMVSDVVGVGADLGYQKWNATDEWNAASDLVLQILLGDPTITGSEWKFSALNYGGHLLVSIPTQGSVRPWLKAGLGFYNLGLEFDLPGFGGDSDSEGKFGFNFGGGIGLAVNPTVTLGVGAAYHVVPADDIGVDFNMFTAGVHATFGPSGN
jgi:opacity protein-like surface antigen